MGIPLELGKYSIGVGDRFGQEAEAQLRACVMALEKGIEIVPVWNKSNREHITIGSEPGSTRAAADLAVRKLGWKGAHFVDADHIRLETVDRFLPYSDFYTIDVADAIGQPASPATVSDFIDRHPELTSLKVVPRLEQELPGTREAIQVPASKYLPAVAQAGKVYRHIAAKRGAAPFITEVSMDETDVAQTPLELLVILAALSDEAVPVQTIAPRFCGSFHKGIDYIGDVAVFERLFRDYLGVIEFAVIQYKLPFSLKLSLHSGSDKFSLYSPIRRALRQSGAGLHLKTAGTTWLEEFIGLVESEGRGLELAKRIAVGALERIDELCAPYQNVVSIERGMLPSLEQIRSWDAERLASAVRHNPRDAAFNPSLRQLIHVGYKLAAENQAEFLELMGNCRLTVARNVSHNLYDRHIRPLFVD